jgi:pimeloyl-ACP methyl ester carboxylesterase
MPRMTHAPRLVLAAVALACAALLAGCDSVGPSLKDTAYSMERSRAGLVRKEMTLPDGTHMVWLEGGQGAPLVLVHGFGADKDNFTRAARTLTPHYRVIVPDLVGFGESSHLPDADYRYAAQAERLHAFVQALGLTRIDIGGNSMGGAISLSYAAQHPQDVRSLWLIDSAGIPEAPPSELAKILAAGGRNPLMVETREDYPRMLAFALVDKPWIPGNVMNVLADERIANAALERKVFAQIATDSVSDAISGLLVPTLITWGADDRVIDVGTVAILHRKLPRSQVTVMPHVGHAPMIEKPAQTAEDYIRFREALAHEAAPSAPPETAR